MGDSNRRELIDATSGLIKSIEGVVRDSTELVKGAAQVEADGTSGGGVKAAPEDLRRTDSPAWLNFHHPGGDKEVKLLGARYHDTHFAGKTSPKNVQYMDPSVGATWKDFARIYANLFSASQAFGPPGAGPSTLRADPYPAVQMLQKQVAIYDVNNPDKLIGPNGIPWPAGGVARPGPDVPVGQAISLFLEQFNKNPDGSNPDRGADFTDPDGNPLPAAPFRLTHGQLVQLRHVFTTQEDLRLLSPYSAISLIW